MTRTNLGRQILERLIKDVEGKSIVEFRPRQEGNTLHAILAPKKEEGGKKEKPRPASPPPAATQAKQVWKSSYQHLALAFGPCAADPTHNNSELRTYFYAETENTQGRG
jgi:hypothetical protein